MSMQTRAIILESKLRAAAEARRLRTEIKKHEKAGLDPSALRMMLARITLSHEKLASDLRDMDAADKKRK